MFLIKVYFKSNVKGVYTEETETATDELSRDAKYNRCVQRWYDILIDSHETTTNFILSLMTQLNSNIKSGYTFSDQNQSNELAKIKLEIIKFIIADKNRHKKDDEEEREFEITVTEF